MAADGARPDGWRRCVDYKVPLVMTPQPEGGYTVTSPLLLLQRYAVSGLTGGAVRG